MLKFLKISVVLLILLIGGLIVSFYATPSIHEYLCMAPQLEKADSIVVFCGGSGYRAVRADTLLKKGYSSHLILCGTEGELQFIMGLFRKNARTQKQRDFLKTIVQVPVPDTKNSVKYVVSLLKADREKRILVVTGCCHIRRCNLLLNYYALQAGNDKQIIKRCRFAHEKASEGASAGCKHIAWAEFLKCIAVIATSYFGLSPL